MVLAATLLAGGASSTDAASYVTASQTPTSGSLVLAAVTGAGTVSTAAPTLAGNGLSWVQIASAVIPAGTLRCTVFRAMGAATPGAVTIDFAGQTQLRCLWSFVEFAGTRTTGSNGAGAIRQFVTADAALGMSGTADFNDPFTNPINGTYSAIVGGNVLSITPEAGFTELHEFQAEQNSLETMWRIGEDQTPTPTFGQNAAWAQIGIEIAAVNGSDPNRMGSFGAIRKPPRLGSR